MKIALSVGRLVLSDAAQLSSSRHLPNRRARRHALSGVRYSLSAPDRSEDNLGMARVFLADLEDVAGEVSGSSGAFASGVGAGVRRMPCHGVQCSRGFATRMSRRRSVKTSGRNQADDVEEEDACTRESDL